MPLYIIWCDFDRASSLICGNKMPTRYNRGFCCRSYYLLNMFQAPLCPSSGAQGYYTVVAACGISCCGFQVAGLVWSWGLCVRFAGSCSNTTGSNHCIILLSSWWWASWCPKHVEQAIRSAIKTSVASSWHFISTYFSCTCTIHIAYSDTLIKRHNLFGPFDEVITEFDCISMSRWIGQFYLYFPAQGKLLIQIF